MQYDDGTEPRAKKYKIMVLLTPKYDAVNTSAKRREHNYNYNNCTSSLIKSLIVKRGLQNVTFL